MSNYVKKSLPRTSTHWQNIWKKIIIIIIIICLYQAYWLLESQKLEKWKNYTWTYRQEIMFLPIKLAHLNFLNSFIEK